MILIEISFESEMKTNEIVNGKTASKEKCNFRNSK